MSMRVAVVGFPWGILEGIWLKVCMCQDTKRVLAIQWFRCRSGMGWAEPSNSGHFLLSDRTCLAVSLCLCISVFSYTPHQHCVNKCYSTQHSPRCFAISVSWHVTNTLDLYFKANLCVMAIRYVNTQCVWIGMFSFTLKDSFLKKTGYLFELELIQSVNHQRGSLWGALSTCSFNR